MVANSTIALDYFSNKNRNQFHSHTHFIFKTYYILFNMVHKQKTAMQHLHVQMQKQCHINMQKGNSDNILVMALIII